MAITLGPMYIHSCYDVPRNHMTILVNGLAVEWGYPDLPVHSSCGFRIADNKMFPNYCRKLLNRMNHCNSLRHVILRRARRGGYRGGLSK